MGTTRKRYSAEFKAKAALEALKGQRVCNEIASDFGVHPTMLAQWKKQASDGLPEVFAAGRSATDKSQEVLVEQLYQQIGQLKVELDWLKKNLESTVPERRSLIDAVHPDIGIRRQCELVGLPQSTWYYKPAVETKENLDFMRILDELYTRLPFYGVERMTAQLRHDGHLVNPKRVRRLLRLMGLEALYPQKSLSEPAPGHKTYPYLLRGLTIVRPHQVWSSDITYIRMHNGFLYLVAVVDWFSRFVLSWELSNTMDVDFCLSAFDRALRHGSPEIWNSDQGSQYTSERMTTRVAATGAQISMDGRGRAIDNVFSERVWWSVKYEEVYLRDYQTVAEAIAGLARYFQFYNYERLHQSLKYQTPSVFLAAGRG